MTKRFNPRGESLQAWDDDGIRKWAGRTNIDLMMNLALLYWASEGAGDPSLAEIATLHARTSRQALVRGDGSTAHVADFGPQTGLLIRREQYQGYSHDSCWSRGQAWALYGFTSCYRYTGVRAFLSTAQALADYTLARLPADLVPDWDYDSPHIPHTWRGSSAAAVTACGFLELASAGLPLVESLGLLRRRTFLEQLGYGCQHRAARARAQESLARASLVSPRRRRDLRHPAAGRFSGLLPLRLDDLHWPMVVWTNTDRGLFDDIRHPTEFFGMDQSVIDAVQFVADLILEHKVMPSDEQRADISDLFAACKSGMQAVGHWRMQRYLGSGFAFDMAALPLGESGEAVNRADGGCFAISADTDHPEEAWELVKFLAGPGSPGVNMLLDLQVMTPALSEFKSDKRFLDPELLPGSNKAAFLAGAGNFFSMYGPIHPMYSAFDSLWKQELGEVWIGAATADEAMGRIADEVAYILENLADYE